MGVPGPGGPTGPSLPQTNSPQENVTTVRTGETTMEQVAKRLRNSGVPDITADALREANKDNPKINPNQLKAGQDIRLPDKSEGKQDSSSSTKNKPQQTNAEGFKSPTIRKGNWEISGKPTGSTSSVADGEGSTASRRERRDQVDGMRQRDDRDIDPAQIKKEKNLKREKEIKAGDPMIKDLEKQSPRGKEQIETGNAYELEMREKLLRQQKGRLQVPQNNPAQAKDQK